MSESERVELRRSLAREVRILRGVLSPFIVKLLGVQHVDLGGGIGGAGGSRWGVGGDQATPAALQRGEERM